MEIKRKSKIGRVVSNKMEKTVVVAVDRRKRRPPYKKTFTRTARYKVHDEKGECGPGDLVKIIEMRPLSKEKRWRVAEILTKSQVGVPKQPSKGI